MECVCKHEMTRHDWKNQWVCHHCGRTKPIKQTQTNADRIRAMSDEEMSVFLWEFDKEEIARATEYAFERRKITEWLKQPAEEESQQDCTYNKNGHCIGQKLMPECDPKSCDRKNQ